MCRQHSSVVTATDPAPSNCPFSLKILTPTQCSLNLSQYIRNTLLQCWQKINLWPSKRTDESTLVGVLYIGFFCRDPLSHPSIFYAKPITRRHDPKVLALCMDPLLYDAREPSYRRIRSRMEETTRCVVYSTPLRTLDQCVCCLLHKTYGICKMKKKKSTKLWLSGWLRKPHKIAPKSVYNGSLFASYSRGDDPRLHGISGFMASDWHPKLSKDRWLFWGLPV